MHGLAFLFVDVFLDHAVGDRAGADRTVAAGPQMFTPELLAKVRKLLKEYSRTDPLQPLHDVADALIRPV